MSSSSVMTRTIRRAATELSPQRVLTNAVDLQTISDICQILSLVVATAMLPLRSMAEALVRTVKEISLLPLTELSEVLTDDTQKSLRTIVLH